MEPRAVGPLKEDPELTARAKELGNKDDDYLMEIVDPRQYNVTILIERGSFEISSDSVGRIALRGDAAFRFSVDGNKLFVLISKQIG